MASLRAVFCCLLGVSVLIGPPASNGDDLAAPTTYEGKPITEIRYDPPHQPVSQEDLARMVTFKPGAALHSEEVRAVLKQLYSTGRYSYIEVDTEPAGTGVALTIRTTEQWFVGPVEVQGKVKLPPNEGQLENAARLELGTPFNDEDLQAAEKGVRDLLDRNGLYTAKITPQVSRDAEHQQVSITFQVNAGKRARLTEPEIKGDPKDPPEKIAKAAKYKGLIRWKQATETTTQKGVENIRNRYDKEDRLTASVRLDHVDYDAESNRAKPTIEANGGPKVKIASSGAKVSKGNLQKYVPVFDEQTVNRDLLVSGVRNLRDYFQNRGYFDVQVNFEQKQIDPDQENIIYTIALGERHKLVKVGIQGNHYFTEQDIRDRMFLQPAGFLRLRHGRYTEGFVRRDEDTIKALYRDNGFREAKVTADVARDYQGKTGEVAVTVTIDEGPQYLVSNVTFEWLDAAGQRRDREAAGVAAGQPFSDTSVRDGPRLHPQSLPVGGLPGCQL